ncbi:MAG: chemotaxis protein CheW [Anaerolineae bacterium]|nr:chemotaxis protein CheW [Anaerolineae bacterium]
MSVPQPVPYTTPDLRVVVFKVAAHEYAVDAALVQEVMQVSDLAHMDGMPDYVEGIVKRRGRIIPVVDIKKRLGLPSEQFAEEFSLNRDKNDDTTMRLTPANFPAKYCVVLVRLPPGMVGLLADAASELMWVKTYDFEVPSPLIAGMLREHSAALRGIAHLGGRLLVMLDPLQLFSTKEWQALPAAMPDLSKAPATLYAGETEKEEDAAQTRRARRRLLTLDLGDELYGIEAGAVAEIREPMPYTPLPNTPDYVLGLVNLRGSVLPVIDLRRRFGLPCRPAGPENRLIILKGAPHMIALWVDKVHELARLSPGDFRPAPPGVARIAPEYYDQVAPVGKRMLIELNVPRLLADGVTM